ncbi:BZ3500_MvSof-1268-A1-R1_Chr2-2g05161 [Microbotryum saponariae]|uniref:BZ3500_MvSof-1268-A1-R1_Chr2-2g05161 protein n=1 Tax=Microbotryum saponariae TaxID=289078 RepID=A0A2X0M9J5_9BASI|nr:BZ3500_MvSof-1268-A1-R1_Chr2-2g05161 [Microbotryum saponariae]SDA00988.1 BZ3501_MvSof-1269-A2-R1_Chr2-2g04835 [Microbotryum saponariae]
MAPDTSTRPRADRGKGKQDQQPGKPYHKRGQPDRSAPTPSQRPHFAARGDRPPRPQPGPSPSPAFQRPNRPRPPLPAQGSAPKPTPSSLTIKDQTLSSPPQLDAHPRLARLELTSCQGLGSLAFLRSARHTLANLNLSGTPLPDSNAWEPVRELSTLIVLNVSNCGLKQVPSVIESLVSLKALVLSHNHLTTLDHVKRLPQLNTLGPCKKLWPESGGLVSYNSLTSLPSADLSSLGQLKKLSASHNLLTSTSLPDLSNLTHLREVRLSNNPKLAQLPLHFIAWGHAPLREKRDEEADAQTAEAEPRRVAGKQGLEVVDLGSCGFEDWFGLKELAKHPIVNLVLKGNKVVDELVEEEGFEAYRTRVRARTGPSRRNPLYAAVLICPFDSQLTTLLSDLKILDNVRFDAKFVELKQKREQRTPQQRVLDAGPMGLAINAKKEKPVDIPKMMLDELEREKEMRRRRKGLERKRKLMGETEGEGGDEGQKDEGAEAQEEKETEEEAKVEVVEAVQQRRKRGRDAKRLGLKKDIGKTASGEVNKPTVSAKEIPAVEDKEEKADGEPAKKKKKTKKGGALDALKGDSSEVVAGAKSSSTPTEAAKQKETHVAENEDPPKKEKTSVLKVIEVKKGKKEAKAKAVDVEDLLGLAKAPEASLFGAGWD